jgi:hypothetical protein
MGLDMRVFEKRETFRPAGGAGAISPWPHALSHLKSIDPLIYERVDAAGTG